MIWSGSYVIGALVHTNRVILQTTHTYIEKNEVSPLIVPSRQCNVLPCPTIKPSNISSLFNLTVSGYALKPLVIGMYVITNHTTTP